MAGRCRRVLTPARLMPQRPPAPSVPASYRRWRSRAAALLERQRISAAVMRERDWRQLYIRGKSPEDAARQAETAYWNARPRFERMGKR
jgi:hypothetical protein